MEVGADPEQESVESRIARGDVNAQSMSELRHPGPVISFSDQSTPLREDACESHRRFKETRMEKTPMEFPLSSACSDMKG